MPDNKFYLSKERLEELEKEYRELVIEKRAEIAEKLKKAKEYGDLSENSEYTEAKDEQMAIEKRIADLEVILKNYEVIKKTGKKDAVEIGSKVSLEKKDGKKFTYTIVGSQEANPDEGKISNESIVGKALLGKKEGDEIAVETLNGKTSYKILNLE
ncbi:MAG: transcription elongation factor GreA [Candidatus Liptonbacteria bacterium RIFOXYB1_FULL_36_10]|uniref:Transcription elongation factor GreA n=1 Tax=Candidatus Liptonbacteria bacterium RIFOXYB1_FULL_36_10 TaxID=1798654 RepID=A0A1G2CPT6_9BACT|nr:MAG: transcription elongation factor GreA [Candidatus Liptonbacteria bacterium RIFOXYB1_FULL_36_10]